MVQRICKICQLPFDFLGGSTMCSDACLSRWEQLRANVYQKTVAPARKIFDKSMSYFEDYKIYLDGRYIVLVRPSPMSHEMELTKEEFCLDARTRLHEARDLHSRFLQSNNPVEFIQNELSEHAYEILGDANE